MTAEERSVFPERKANLQDDLQTYAITIGHEGDEEILLQRHRRILSPRHRAIKVRRGRGARHPGGTHRNCASSVGNPARDFTPAEKRCAGCNGGVGGEGGHCYLWNEGDLHKRVVANVMSQTCAGINAARPKKISFPIGRVSSGYLLG